MLGIIVGTHGHLAEELVKTCAMICGEPENLKTVTLVPGEGPDDLIAKYNKAIEEMDTTNGVIILMIYLEAVRIMRLVVLPSMMKNVVLLLV